MNIEQELQKIHKRNRAVEANKAWEMSLFRRNFIGLLTYGCAFLFLWMAHVETPWLGAFVPVLGYALSTLSLPPLRKWWIGRFYR